ncbi:kinase-like domain-containing protein [Rhizophagus clarus]|uniref:Kinase-like domain-containing protein n=1 Tax=Rhizophagus clarus TaxID=94130 RepID=A0A8H3QPE2_9GLOM|nr:kinase-like domain-containing protein [Rhizophagus clarus]
MIKCRDAEIKNRPATKELYQLLNKWNSEAYDGKCEIYFQTKECDKIGEKKFYNRSNESKSKSIQIHPQAIYTSRLLNVKNLPKPVNSTDLLSIQINSVSECLDVQLSELELNEIYQDKGSNIE